MRATADTVLLILSIAETFAPRRIELSGQQVVIGRDAACDIVLPDMAVSRRHLRLARHGAGWQVTTLPGAGLLFVNGAQADHTELRPGDQLVVGGCVLRFEVAETAHAAAGGAALATVLAAPPAPTLTVEWPGGRFAAPLAGETITLGRAPESGIVVPSSLISTHHARLIRAPDGSYAIEEVEPLNPLTLRGKRVRRHLLQQGDTLLVGDRASGQYVALSYGVASTAAGAASLALPAAGGGAALIGRDPASALPLLSPLVSWRHARLTRTAGAAALLEDLGSTNGTYINYQRIRAATPLRAGDRIQIGPYAFTFDGAALLPDAPSTGMRLDARDLVRTTRNGQTVLLDQVTLSVLPGEFVAIAGGNGAGKTTLMKALAGIQPAQRGQVLFDGVDGYRQTAMLRGRIGYVPQADIVHGALTVERALYYAARLRLASDLRDDEIERRIGEVLAEVDLTAHRHKVVEKLSGGEKKRASLAVELLAQPPILFLDEPNAALDPNHRRDLLRTIRTLTAHGHTIIMVTHFLEDIAACDRVAVMGRGGRLCFYGPPAAATAFFRVPAFEDVYTQIDEASQAESWRQRFAGSAVYEREVRARQVGAARAGVPSSPAASAARARREHVRRLGFAAQLALLTRRYAEVLARDRVNAAILLLQAPIIGVVLAAVSKDGVFTSALGPFEAQKVLFFLAIVAIWFGTSNAVREISKEGDIYERERLAGLGVAPYVLSKVGLLALLCALQTAVLLAIVSIRTGLPPQRAGLLFGATPELYIGMTLAGLAGLALGLCVSAFASTSDKAVAAVPLVLLPQILLAGVIFPVSGPIQTVADATISRWAVQALGTTADLDRLYYFQLAEQPAPPSDAAPRFAVGDYDAQPDAAHYNTQSVAATAAWDDARDSRQAHLLLTWGILAGLFVGFVALAMLRQRAKDPT